MLLTSRKLLQRKLLDLELELRGTLRNFGLKVGIVSGSRYEARVRELVTDFPRLAAIAEPLLNVRRGHAPAAPTSRQGAACCVIARATWRQDWHYLGAPHLG